MWNEITPLSLYVCLYFSIGNGQPGEPALIQLYRRTFVSCIDDRRRWTDDAPGGNISDIASDSAPCRTHRSIKPPGRTARIKSGRIVRSLPGRWRPRNRKCRTFLRSGHLPPLRKLPSRTSHPASDPSPPTLTHKP